MVKLLIVEDEAVILNGYKQAIDWQDNGIELVGVAEDGVQALEIVENKKPDIVITDVVMPNMDGIALVENLRNNYPKIRTIIISGHDEFEYARDAIDSGVSKYLLKPLRLEILLQEVIKLKEEIQEEEKNYIINEEMKEKIKTSMPLLRNQFMNTLLQAYYTEESTIEEKFNYLDIKLSTKNIFVMVIQLDNYLQKMKALKSEEFYGLNIEIQDICYKAIASEVNCYVFEDKKDNIILLMNWKEAFSEKENLGSAFELGTKIQNEVQNLAGYTVSIGIGRFKKGVLELPQAYMEAIKALEYKFFMGNNSIIYFDDVDLVTEENFDYPENLEEEILTSIRTGNYNRACTALEAFFKLLENNKDSGVEKKGNIITILINSICRYLINIKNPQAEIVNKSFIKMLNDFQGKSKGTLKELMLNMEMEINNIIEIINSNRDFRKSTLMQNAVNFIKENINKDVSLQTVAEAVYISSNYLSALFKENFDEGFKEFVIRIKMDKANELLLTTDLSVKQVAYELGYSDWRHFSRTFKKIKGKNPEEIKQV
jgi:two-component system response regulator YesN